MSLRDMTFLLLLATYKVIGGRKLRIVIEGPEHIKKQQEALRRLSLLNHTIVSIRNESKTLEDIFQEVCAL